MPVYEMRLTNFFDPPTSADLAIAVATDEDINTLSLVTGEEDGAGDLTISFSIADGALSNVDYKCLLDRFLVSTASNNDIYWAYKSEYLRIPPQLLGHPDSHPCVREADALLSKIDINTQKEILNLSRCCRYRLGTLSALYKLDSYVINRILRKNKQIEKRLKGLKWINQRKTKLQDIHIDFISNLFNASKGSYITVGVIKEKIIKSFNEIDSISDKTIRNVL